MKRTNLHIFYVHFCTKRRNPRRYVYEKILHRSSRCNTGSRTMITAQAADTIDGTVVSGTYKRSTNGGRRRGLKSPAGGAWEKLSDGTYKYHFAEGLEATDYWLEIDGTWYYFGHDNIMQTGWVKDDGNWYYMDLETGALFTGWHEISGKWSYFHEEGDGFKGTLMVNCETPDGYTVDVNGALVE